MCMREYVQTRNCEGVFHMRAWDGMNTGSEHNCNREQASEEGEQVRPPPGAPSPAVPLSHAVSLMSPLVAVVQLTVLLSSDAKVVGGRACAPGLKRSGNGNKDTSVLTISPVLSAYITLTTHPLEQTLLATLSYTIFYTLCHTPSLLTTLLA